MKTSVNLTGRIEIPRENIVAQVKFADGRAELCVEWDIQDLGVPEDAELVMDFWASGTYETRRCFLGEAVRENTRSENIDVFDMRNSNKIKLRFMARKLINNLPMIVAQVDQVAVVTLGLGEDPNSLLKIASDSDLGSPWKLKIEDGAPILMVKDLDGLYPYLKSEAPWFKPIVLTEVFSQIFDWYVGFDEDEDRDQFVAEKWKSLFEDCGADAALLNQIRDGEIHRTDTRVEELKDLVLRAFVSKHGFFSALIEIMTDSEGVVE